MEKTENNPVAQGLRLCFPNGEKWREWLSIRKARKCQGLSTMYPVGRNLNGC